ncbi:MAG TPA: hypothetical protein VNM72_06130, partial [Blastocatellia bacterium]|nr:hypothetical protein [Blastocatellia bacterium]
VKSPASGEIVRRAPGTPSLRPSDILALLRWFIGFDPSPQSFGGRERSRPALWRVFNAPSFFVSRFPDVSRLATFGWAACAAICFERCPSRAHP